LAEKKDLFFSNKTISLRYQFDYYWAMVEFIIPKCESCGAELHIPQGQESGTCEYCGTDFRVVDPARSTPVMGGAGTELEKKELALQIAQKDLRDLETQSWQLKSRIDQFENPRPLYRKGGGPMVAVYIIGIMAIFMTAMLGGLFWVLQIYYIYGLTPTTCPLLMFGVIIASVVFMIATKIVSDSAARKKYEAGLASPEYPQTVAQFNELQPKIVAAQAEVNKREQELRDFVK
jgi:hypothetical protein